MKRFAALLTAFTLALGMTACGADSSSAAPQGEAFTLGTIGPLTGTYAIYGEAVAGGAKMAVDEINAQGGIQFNLLSADDVTDPETSVNAYHKLLDDGMQILVSPTTTACAIEVATHVYEDRIFMLTPSASAPDVTKDKDNVYRVCFTDPDLGTLAADYMAEHHADAKIGVLYRSDEAYSNCVRDVFTSEAKKKNLNIVYDGSFTEDTSTNFEVQLTAARSAGVDLLFIPIYYQPASVVLNQAAAMGYAPLFFGVDGLDGLLTLPNFDVALAEDVVMMTPFAADAEDERTKKFVEDYKAAYGIVPNQFAADAYDAVYIVKNALEKAGCTPDQSPEELCEILSETIKELEYDGITGKDMKWGDDGNVTKEPRVVVIKDGKYVQVEE